MDGDPIFSDPFDHRMTPRRAPTNEYMRRLLDRIAVEGHLEVSDLSPEERATAHILNARGLIRLEGEHYVQVVMG